jgi:4-amino-4-deoxy-L-arabinose transferase-like glycosyltransferase
MALAAAIMLKGPIGIALTLPTVVALRGSKTSFLPLVIGLIVAAPWFVFATVQTNGEFARSFFWHHNFERATGSASDLAIHPAWFYVVRWLVDLLPVTPVILLAAWYGVRHRLLAGDAEFRLGLIWVLVMSVVLSCAQFKRADYLLPAYPGMAILFGCLAERIHRSEFRPRWYYAVGGGTLAMTFSMALIYELAMVPRENVQRGRLAVAARISSLRELSQPLILFRVEDHLLTFHVGRPVHFVKEWENLDVWISRLPRGLLVLNDYDAASWTQYVHSGTLREMYRHHDAARSRTIVVMESYPNWITSSP